MENYDIVIKNCQVLQPDMTISGECSVAIKDSWIRKIGSAEEIAAAGTAAQTLDGNFWCRDWWTVTPIRASSCCGEGWRTNIR